MRAQCIICDKEFDARGRAETCSPECSQELRREWYRSRRKKNAIRYRERYRGDADFREQEKTRKRH